MFTKTTGLLVTGFALAVSANAAFLENTGPYAGTVRFEAEDYDARQPGTYDGETIEWSEVPAERGGFPSEYANYSGDGYMQLRLDRGKVDTGTPNVFEADDAVMSYEFTITTPGDWRVYARMSGHTTGSDSFWLRIRETGQFYRFAAPNDDFRNSDFADSWRSLGILNDSGGEVAAVMTLAAGTYTLDVSLREDGLSLDQFLLLAEDQVSVYGGATDSTKEPVPFSIPEPMSLVMLSLAGLGLRRR